MTAPARSESMATACSSSTPSAPSSVGGSATPVALPTEEALQILLSPDGYYKYLGIPKPEPNAIGPKHQAAMAVDGAPTESNCEGIDLDKVKKNYRRLSLRHHPDRKTGDNETFRMLNRAKVVLSSAKLRREYDLVGLDLEDDAEEDVQNQDENNTARAENGEGNDDGEAKDGAKDEGKSQTETVMGHLASATLAAVLQVVVRTGVMGLVSTVISRFTILAYLAMGILAFISIKIYSALKNQLGSSAKMNFSSHKDTLSPLAIALGIYCMYRGRRFVDASASGGEMGNEAAGDSTAKAEGSETYLDWSWTFLLGELIVMMCFMANSFEKRSCMLLLLFFALSFLLSLWLGGRFWRYTALLGIEGTIALLVVLAFPVMEMILDSIVEDKMRKVGDKIRAHDERMRKLLSRKREQQQDSS